MNRSPEEDVEVILPPGPGQFEMNDIAQELDQDEFDGPVSNGKLARDSLSCSRSDFSFDLEKINKLLLIKTLSFCCCLHLHFTVVLICLLSPGLFSCSLN